MAQLNTLNSVTYPSIITSAGMRLNFVPANAPLLANTVAYRVRTRKHLSPGFSHPCAPSGVTVLSLMALDMRY